MFKDLFTESQKVMTYVTACGKEISIVYNLRGAKAFFKVPKRDTSTNKIIKGFSDELSVQKDRREKTFDPELAIFNYLKSLDY